MTHRIDRYDPATGTSDTRAIDVDDTWVNNYFRRSGRVFLSGVWRSHENGYVTARCLRNRSQFGNPSAESLERAIHRAFTFKVDGKCLFQYNPKTQSYVRQYLPGETPKQFERRALTCTSVESELRLYWQVQLMVAKKGVAPHSLEQFAADLRMHKVTASRGLKALVEKGLIRRFGGRGNFTKKGCCRYMNPYFGNPGDEPDEHKANEIELRYGRHRERNYLNVKNMRERWRQIRCKKPLIAKPRSSSSTDSDAIRGKNSLLAVSDMSVSNRGAELLAKPRTSYIHNTNAKGNKKVLNNARHKRWRDC